MQIKSTYVAPRTEQNTPKKLAFYYQRFLKGRKKKAQYKNKCMGSKEVVRKLRAGKGSSLTKLKASNYKLKLVEEDLPRWHRR